MNCGQSIGLTLDSPQLPAPKSNLKLMKWLVWSVKKNSIAEYLRLYLLMWISLILFIFQLMLLSLLPPRMKGVLPPRTIGNVTT